MTPMGVVRGYGDFARGLKRALVRGQSRLSALRVLTSAVAVLLVFAIVWLDRRLVQAALVSYVVAVVPHLAYHATALDNLSTGDAVAEMARLALNMVVPLGLLALTRRRPVAA